MFPTEFTQRMKALLQEDYDEFIACLAKPRYQALRFNPLKHPRLQEMTMFGDLQPVDWEKNGFYYHADSAPGQHPYHQAGVYYIQEPSAMAPAAYLNAQPGEIILDLCAAPGGKSTQIAGDMMGKGLLISNEIHPARARILSENIERMGIDNCIVTNESPQKLTEHFEQFFDRIMVDAPCSGEGMFRKNEEAIAQWSLENVMLCARRQDEILECAHQMLKPGGTIVYSTCTFAPEENEETILRFCKRHPEYHMPKIPMYSGMVHGMTAQGTMPGTIRLFPHKIHGEGHFLAVLKKNKENDSNDNSGLLHGIQPSLEDKELAQFREFEKETLNISFQGTFVRFKDDLYVLDHDMPNLKGLKVLRPGLHLGTMKKGRFEPGHALALRLCYGSQGSDIKPEYVTNLDPQMAKQYLQGQTFVSQGQKGWHVITVDHYSIGWGKLAGDVMKNHYPKGLRR